ncbi:MAG: Hsp20/alpha crystallin family protein [Saprospiraceae bacterium]|nr:Hsp20/alpha crystallin family protein [Candidatus Brachybacter algidus]
MDIFQKTFWRQYVRKNEPPFSKRYGKRFGNRKSVNILETADAYILKLYAAGLRKDLFTISIDEDVINISYQPEAASTEDKFIYEEYRPMAFERAQLNDKVLKDQINAAYTDGVLEVTLPKDPEAHKPGQSIEIR